MSNFSGIKLAVGGLVVAGAVMAGSITSANISNQNKGDNNKNSQSSSKKDDVPIIEFNPITDEIKAIAEEYDYTFEAKDVLIKEKEESEYDFSEASSVPTNANRDDANLVFVFEGAYAEGYQGDYSETYASMYLWDDGLYGGTVGSTAVRGFWYNSSLKEGSNPETGEDIQDCLNLVSNVSKYESIICKPASGFYEWRAHIYLGFSWGTRSMEVSAYRYYPEVALAIDPSLGGTEYKVGQVFDRDGWVADRILKNLNYSAVFKASEVTWTDGEGIKNKQAFTEAGEFEVTAKWNGFEAKIKVSVTE